MLTNQRASPAAAPPAAGSRYAGFGIAVATPAAVTAAQRAAQPSLGQAKATGVFGALLGRSPGMQEVYRQILRVAPTAATVFLSGETGTGKELVARTIHDLSERRDAAFVALNCGAISTALAESELFGHERGSFTGANRAHDGVFAQADAGTLFLDEVSEMPIDLQVKLLRVLETGVYRRIGAEQDLRSDVRIVAACNRVPAQAVRDGRLREDLFYRLRVFPLPLPPLRERLGDVPLLAEHFLGRLNAQAGTQRRFTAEAIVRLQAHAWPGNVRELRHYVQHAYLLADGDLDAAAMAPATGSTSPVDHVEVRVGASISEAVRLLVLATMERHGGNKRQVAKVLGISLKTLYSRLGVYAASGAGEAPLA